MRELFATGRVADLILLILAIEAALLWLGGKRTGDLRVFKDMAPGLFSGACLALALRGALTGVEWMWIAAALMAACAGHAIELVTRLRKGT